DADGAIRPGLNFVARKDGIADREVNECRARAGNGERTNDRMDIPDGAAGLSARRLSGIALEVMLARLGASAIKHPDVTPSTLPAANYQPYTTLKRLRSPRAALQK
ncbi:MAG: hypothetical protein WBW73_26985, partial [Rhodoplanes sp.]